MKGIPAEVLITTLADLQDARNAIDRADPLNCAMPNGLSARLSASIGRLRFHLIDNLPERVQLRDAA